MPRARRPTPILLLPLLVASLAGRRGEAGSVAFDRVSFERTVAMSARILKGRVIGTPTFRFEGREFHSLAVRVEGALKGPAVRAGETFRLFSPGQWFQHTHAAMIKAGVVSYADSHFASPVPRRELEAGAPVLFFLGAESPPAGFPPNAAFLFCNEAYAGADRAPEAARIRSGALGEKITLKVGETVFFPEGLQLQVTGHSHKRPTTGGPRRETAELLATRGARAQRLDLGHVVDGAKETWDRKTFEGFEVELLQMTPDADTTLRVRRAGS